MPAYAVLTSISGLPRADGLKKPVEAGAIVAIPFFTATDLLDIGAIEPTDEQVTLALDWPGAPDPISPTISVVAVTDRHALVAAIEELGGIVFFVGEGLPDDADRVLGDFPNEVLLGEIEDRISGQRLTATSFSTSFLPGLIFADPASAIDPPFPPGDWPVEEPPAPVAEADPTPADAEAMPSVDALPPPAPKAPRKKSAEK